MTKSRRASNSIFPLGRSKSGHRKNWWTTGDGFPSFVFGRPEVPKPKWLTHDFRLKFREKSGTRCRAGVDSGESTRNILGLSVAHNGDTWNWFPRFRTPVEGDTLAF